MFTRQSTSSIGLGLHPFWRDDDGIHVVLGNFAGEIQLSSFSSVAGHEESAVVYANPEGDWAASYTDVAASPEGDFALALTPSFSTLGMIMGRSSQPSVTSLIEPGWEEGTTLDVAWNGEAFVWHLAYEGQLLTATLDTTGDILNVPSPVSGFTGTLPNRYHIATDPVTGSTWEAGTAGGGVRVHGYLRGGETMPGGEEGVPIVLGELLDPGEEPTVAVGNGGAAVAFDKYNEGVFLVPITEELAFDKYLVIPPKLNRSNAPISANELALAWSRDSWWLFVVTQRGVTVYEVRDHEILDEWVLVEHPVSSCGDEGPFCSEIESYQSFTVDSPYAYAWDDELWFGFRDNSQIPGTGSLHPYRVVRVLPGCSYLSVNELQTRGIEIPTQARFGE